MRPLVDESVKEDSKERADQPNQDNLTHARDNCITQNNLQNTKTTRKSVNNDNEHQKKEISTEIKGEQSKTRLTKKATRTSLRNARKNIVEHDATKDDNFEVEVNDTPKFTNVTDSLKLSRIQPRRSSRASVPR